MVSKSQVLIKGMQAQWYLCKNGIDPLKRLNYEIFRMCKLSRLAKLPFLFQENSAT